MINSLKIGGAEILLKNFVIEAKKNKQYTVDVCALHATNDAKNIEEIKKKNVGIWTLDLKNKYDISSVIKIKNIIQRENYDVIHVHLFPASAFVALSSLFLKKSIVYLFTIHNTFNRRRSIKIFKIIDGLIYKRYAKIICISKEVQNSLLKWVPKIKEKVEIIPNGIPVNSKSNDNLLMKRYDVLFVGRLVKQKGINFLLEAVSILQEKYKKIIRVAIVGDGPLKIELIKMSEELKIKDSVEFLGFIKDVDRIMRSSRVLVLPSRWEGFGLVLLEAMKNKLPIIATNVGGIPEIIINGHEGILIPKKNSKILATSIKKVLGDKEIREKLIQNAYKKMQGNYSIEEYAHNIFNLYSKMMNDNSKLHS